MIDVMIASLKASFKAKGDIKGGLAECVATLSSSTEKAELDLRDLPPHIVAALLNAVNSNRNTGVTKVQIERVLINSADVFEAFCRFLRTNRSAEEVDASYRRRENSDVYVGDVKMSQVLRAWSENPHTAVKKILGIPDVSRGQWSVAVLCEILATNRSLTEFDFNFFTDDERLKCLQSIMNNPHSRIAHITFGYPSLNTCPKTLAFFKKMLRTSRTLKILTLDMFSNLSDENVASLLNAVAENPKSAVEEFHLRLGTDGSNQTAVALKAMLTANHPLLTQSCTWQPSFNLKDEDEIRRMLTENISKNSMRVQPANIRREQGKYNWSRFALVASFCRSNYGHVFESSVIPLVSTIQQLIGFDHKIIPDNGYLRTDRFMDTAYFQSVTRELGPRISLIHPQPETGYCHIFRMPPQVRSILVENPNFAPVLYENARCLTRFDNCEFIRGMGRGAYTSWPPEERIPGLFYVSATDSSDPGTNRRAYRVHFERIKLANMPKNSSFNLPPPIAISNFSPENGYCHIFEVPPYLRKLLQEYPEYVFVLYENGERLRSVANEKVIRSEGGGRYYAWPRQNPQLVYFAARDNSNPKTNGKTYQLCVERAEPELNSMLLSNSASVKGKFLPVKLSNPSSETGFCHVVGIPATARALLLRHPEVFPALYENGNRLKEVDNEKIIRSEGGGRYYAWPTYNPELFYFAASDNSIPASNGRTYELRFEGRVPREQSSNTAKNPKNNSALYFSAQAQRCFQNFIELSMRSLGEHLKQAEGEKENLEQYAIEIAEINRQVNTWHFPSPDSDKKERTESNTFGAVLEQFEARRKELKIREVTKLFTEMREFYNIYNFFKCPINSNLPDEPVRIGSHSVIEQRRQLYNRSSIVQMIVTNQKCLKTDVSLADLVVVEDGKGTVKPESLKSAEMLLYVFALAAEKWIKALPANCRQIQEVSNTSSASQISGANVLSEIEEAERAFQALWKKASPEKINLAEQIYAALLSGDNAVVKPHLTEEEIQCLGFLIPAAITRQASKARENRQFSPAVLVAFNDAAAVDFFRNYRMPSASASMAAAGTAAVTTATSAGAPAVATLWPLTNYRSLVPSATTAASAATATWTPSTAAAAASAGAAAAAAPAGSAAAVDPIVAAANSGANPPNSAPAKAAASANGVGATKL